MNFSKEERAKLIEDIKDFDRKLSIIVNRNFDCSDSILKQVHSALYDKIPSDEEIERLPDYMIRDYVKRFEYEKNFDRMLKTSSIEDIYNDCEVYTWIMRAYLKMGKIDLALKLLEETDCFNCYWEIAMYFYLDDKQKSKEYFKKCKMLYPSIRDRIPRDILNGINYEDDESEYDKYMKYRKVENILEDVIFSKHLRFIVLKYIGIIDSK
jgi:tetratricopeptide (TPR) repeat protein